jgi:hypothetical protein
MDLREDQERMLYQLLPSKNRGFEIWRHLMYAGVININVKKATNKFDIALWKPIFKRDQMTTEVVTMEIMLNRHELVQVLVKKKFHQRNCKFSLRGQTGRAKDATGNLFNLMLGKELLKQELTLMRYL